MSRRFAKTSNIVKLIFFIVSLIGVCACRVGPNYTAAPTMIIPENYKEAHVDWKKTKPLDACHKGAWWQVFNDEALNALAVKINISNQNIVMAEAQYRQAQAVIEQNRASLFPLGGLTANTARQKNITFIDNTKLYTKQFVTLDTLSLSASWEPDLWGGVRRLIEANTAVTKASEAMLENTRLSMQASLLQYYFQLHALDIAQQYLNTNNTNYKKLLNIVKNQYAAGTASRLEVLQAENQVNVAQAAALDNGVNRAQYEHAIATLLGLSPAQFTIKANARLLKIPTVPAQIPSTLLERRPDIAAAERQVAAANANIGVAIAGFFPNFSLNALKGIESNHIATIFSAPAHMWSMGAGVAGNLIDGGLNTAKTKAARASFDAAVANYRQTVLTAFQEVEDNLAAVRILSAESIIQHEIVKSAEASLQVIMNQYENGVANFAAVLNAMLSVDMARQTAADVHSNRLLATVALIKALGGGWN